MSIKTFIQQEVLLPRLRQSGVLVVYDNERRYRELCGELASEQLRVVDASDSSIESREQALVALQQLGQSKPPFGGLLVYVPARAPLSDEDCQRDPFSIYAACGAVFPDPKDDGDEFFNVCLRAKPDHATALRKIFAENTNPDFAIIDAVGGGISWPTTQAVLQVESARDMLFALLVPSDRQRTALKAQDVWVSEVKELLQNTLGLRLITRARSWEPIGDELWRFVLFSEFAFDLPTALPTNLNDVPQAPPAARPVIEDLCDRLRNDRRTQALYITRAEAIETELNLPTHCAAITDLGVRDTFPFEERSFFAQAVEALKRDNVDRLRELFDRHQGSIWVGRGENQAQWQLLQAAASLMQACDDADRQLPDHTRSLDTLLDFYITSAREVDRLQREFEQAAGDYIDGSGQMNAILAQARLAYQRFANKLQGHVLRQLERASWPPSGRLANTDAFDKIIAPRLQESGQRVAVFLIDALRYELGVELQKHLVESGQVELQPAFAQLPSVTPIGMASLLPGAGQALYLAKKGDDVVPVLGDQPLTNVSQRMDVLHKRYGQRFAETGLGEFIKGKGVVAAPVELLVIRSNEMDSDFERNHEAAPGLIIRTFQQIVAAIHKLRGLGFQDVVILSDHGFFLNTAAGAGDVCLKPAGTWVIIHERMLLGDGVSDAANAIFPSTTLGIRSDFNQVAVPRALVAYRAGQVYFHGGISLQEAIVPVITVRLNAPDVKVSKAPKIELDYKRGAKRITTRLPVVEVTIGEGDLFSMGDTFDILLEAHDRQGKLVGEAKPGGVVNATTKLISVKPGEIIQVTLKMFEEFEGKFTVKVLNPATLTTFHKIDLETDYTV